MSVSTHIASRDADKARRRRPIRLGEIALVVLICAAATACRVVLVLGLSDAKLDGDQPYYFAQASRMLDGEVVDARRGPAYSAMLAFFQHEFGRGVTVARMANVSIGALTILLIWLLGRLLFGSTTALIAAGLIAFHPRYISFALILESENLFTLLSVLSLLVCVFASRSEHVLWSMLAGCVLGLCALTREQALYFIPVAAILVVLLGGAWRLRWFRGCLIVITAMVVIAPWTVRNYHVYGRFVPIGFSDAIPLYEGNCKHWYDYTLASRDRALIYNRLLRESGLPADSGHAHLYANEKLRPISWGLVKQRQPWWIFEKLAQIGPQIIWPGAAFPPVWNELYRVTRSKSLKQAAIVLFLVFHVISLFLGIIGVARWRLREPTTLLVVFLLYTVGIQLVALTGVRFQLPFEWVLILLGVGAMANSSSWKPREIIAGALLLLIVAGSQVYQPRKWKRVWLDAFPSNEQLRQ